jgi:hypothetical protein
MRVIGATFSLLLHCCLILAGGLVFEFTPPPGASQPAKPFVKPRQIMEVVLQEKPAQPLPPGKVYEVLARAKLPHQTMPNLGPVKFISPKKVDRPVQIPKVSQEVADKMFFGGYMKQGNELRLSLRAIGAADFTTKDFLGRYKVAGEDRTIEIHQGAGENLLFVDNSTGMRRLLKKVGKFIYTYGPGFDVQEPVVGSITFFPHTHEKTSLPSRLMWLPDTPPSKIATMMHWWIEGGE